MLLPQAQGLFVFQLTSLNKRDIVMYRESSRRTRANLATNSLTLVRSEPDCTRYTSARRVTMRRRGLTRL